MIPAFSYTRAKSVRDAVSQLSSKARIHAGGTDLLGCLRDNIFDIEKVVSISGLSDLRKIREDSGMLKIGALVTLAEIADDAAIRKRYPALAQGALAAASPQLRNQGTLGGNLCQKPRCWYYRGEFHCLRKGGERCFAVGGENQYHCILGGQGCYIVHPSDTAPALIAYNGSVNVTGPNGSRLIPLEKFFVLPSQDVTRETVLAPNEIVTDILLPALPSGTKSLYRKVRARQAWDFALAGIALSMQMDSGTVKGARIVLSGAAPIPWRSREAEEAINGQILNITTARQAAAAAVKDARPLEHNGYKVALFKGVIEEALMTIA